MTLFGTERRRKLTPMARFAWACSAAALMAVLWMYSGDMARALAAPPSGGSGLVADKGKFRIRVNGQDAGKEEFEIGPSGAGWVAHGVTEIRGPDGDTKVTGTLELRSDGTPVRYEWETQGTKRASATIAFTGSTATINLRVDGSQPFTQQFTFNTPQIVVLDNNLYDQYVVLAHLYDWSKGGVQPFAVLVPQAETPGMLTVESVGKQNIDGKSMDELQVKTEDLEVDLYLDGNRLMRIVAPSSAAEIIRD